MLKINHSNKGGVKTMNDILVTGTHNTQGDMMEKYLSLLSERKIDEAKKIMKKSIPYKLIKFFSITDDKAMNEKKLSTLENEKLWFATPAILNDPYEFQCMYIDGEKLKAYDYPDDIIEIFKDLLNGVGDKFALVSLSGNNFDYLPMWAYYTNNYKGYCVEYEVVSPDKIFKVGYESERIPLASIISNLYHEIIEHSNCTKKDNESLNFYNTLISHQLLLKHLSWQHEDEYRVLYPVQKCSGKLVEIKAIGLKTNKIVAGFNCPKEYKEKLNEISKNLGCGNISVAKISDNKYTLFEEIE